ncbi:MAG TPA: hypothetical protein VHL09_09660 [Dehalococcoidia bacterium]|nr:hypothetical protein [Dehalococcoidia bacterium]
MARPRDHALISLALAAAFTAATGSRKAGLAALAVGTLIDADHLVDLLVVYRTKQRDWLIMPLHGWEHLLAGALILSRRPGWGLLAAVISYGVHVSTDHWTNLLGPAKIYSILYRTRCGFRASRLNIPFEPHDWVEQNPLKWV